MYYEIEEIRKRYNEGCYKYHEAISSDRVKLPYGHIFDEDLSVKRNRELVEEHNRKIDELRAEQIKKQLELDKQLAKDVVDYIKEFYSLNEEQARYVEKFTYDKYHSFMGDYFSNIDEVADFADELVNLGKE